MDVVSTRGLLILLYVLGPTAIFGASLSAKDSPVDPTLSDAAKAPIKSIVIKRHPRGTVRIIKRLATQSSGIVPDQHPEASGNIFDFQHLSKGRIFQQSLTQNSLSAPQTGVSELGQDGLWVLERERKVSERRRPVPRQVILNPSIPFEEENIGKPNITKRSRSTFRKQIEENSNARDPESRVQSEGSSQRLKKVKRKLRRRFYPPRGKSGEFSSRRGRPPWIAVEEGREEEEEVAKSTPWARVEEIHEGNAPNIGLVETEEREVRTSRPPRISLERNRVNSRIRPSSVGSEGATAGEERLQIQTSIPGEPQSVQDFDSVLNTALFKPPNLKPKPVSRKSASSSSRGEGRQQEPNNREAKQVLKPQPVVSLTQELWSNDAIQDSVVEATREIHSQFPQVSVRKPELLNQDIRPRLPESSNQDLKSRFHQPQEDFRGRISHFQNNDLKSRFQEPQEDFRTRIPETQNQDLRPRFQELREDFRGRIPHSQNQDIKSRFQEPQEDFRTRIPETQNQDLRPRFQELREDFKGRIPHSQNQDLKSRFHEPKQELRTRLHEPRNQDVRARFKEPQQDFRTILPEPDQDLRTSDIIAFNHQNENNFDEISGQRQPHVTPFPLEIRTFHGAITTPTSLPTPSPSFDYPDYEDLAVNPQADKNSLNRPEDEAFDNFRYGYKVGAEDTANFHARSEQREGKRVFGSYEVALPDGRIQTVTYVADDDGFRAEVSYKEDANRTSTNSLRVFPDGNPNLRFGSGLHFLTTPKPVPLQANKNSLHQKFNSVFPSKNSETEGKDNDQSPPRSQISPPKDQSPPWSQISPPNDQSLWPIILSLPPRSQISQPNDQSPPRFQINPPNDHSHKSHKINQNKTGFSLKPTSIDTNPFPVPEIPQKKNIQRKKSKTSRPEPNPKKVPSILHREVAKVPPNPLTRTRKRKHLHTPVKPEPKLLNIKLRKKIDHPLHQPGAFNRPVSLSSLELEIEPPHSNILPTEKTKSENSNTNIRDLDVPISPNLRNENFLDFWNNFSLQSRSKSPLQGRKINGGGIDFSEDIPVTPSPHPFKLVVQSESLSTINPRHKPTPTILPTQPTFERHSNHISQSDPNFEYEDPDMQFDTIELLKTNTEQTFDGLFTATEPNPTPFVHQLQHTRDITLNPTPIIREPFKDITNKLTPSVGELRPLLAKKLRNPSQTKSQSSNLATNPPKINTFTASRDEKDFKTPIQSNNVFQSAKPILFNYHSQNGTRSPTLLYDPNKTFFIHALGQMHAIPLLLPIEPIEDLRIQASQINSVPSNGLPDGDVPLQRSDIYPPSPQRFFPS